MEPHLNCGMATESHLLFCQFSTYLNSHSGESRPLFSVLASVHCLWPRVLLVKPGGGTITCFLGWTLVCKTHLNNGWQDKLLSLKPFVHCVWLVIRQTRKAYVEWRSRKRSSWRHFWLSSVQEQIFGETWPSHTVRYVAEQWERDSLFFQIVGFSAKPVAT